MITTIIYMSLSLSICLWIRRNMLKDKMIHSFYKENGLWFIDLPEFLEQGLGTKANLLMVDGADTYLDGLSNNGDNVKVQIDTLPYNGMQNHLTKIRMGLDKDYLSMIGHAPVEYGAYYQDNASGHVLWLCPVTEYVFGRYPEDIYLSVL